MDALSIAIAFLAILTPGAVLYGGIYFLAQRRAAKNQAAQDKEAFEQAERLEAMARLRIAANAKAGLRSVGRNQ